MLEGSHNWLLLIQCSPYKFQHLPSDPQTELINAQIWMWSSKSTFTTHIHVLQKSVLGLWEAGQGSEVPWTPQTLCTKCVYGPTPYPQLRSVLQLYLLSVFPHKDIGAGLRKGYVQSKKERQSCSCTSLSWYRCTKTAQKWVLPSSCGNIAVLNPKRKLQFCSRSPHWNAIET